MIAIMLGAGLQEELMSSGQFLIFVSLAIVGLILLGFAALFGGHDAHEIGHGFGHDGGHDGAHDAGHGDGDTAPSFLSPRVFFAFLLGFGVAGAIATVYGAKAGVATGIGFIPGMVMGLIAWGMAVVFYKQQVNSNVQPRQMVGAIGTVVTTIPAGGGIGEVNISVNGQLLPCTAMSADGDSIKVGTPIRVKQYYGDKVAVEKNVAVASKDS